MTDTTETDRTAAETRRLLCEVQRLHAERLREEMPRGGGMAPWQWTALAVVTVSAGILSIASAIAVVIFGIWFR